ncbi:CAP domain-containing protein [Streptomyces sp. NPDC048272]|uniref:CAP domain-containing protein n=1 Tax=Streptomyces sp. NPDC048272 TaxID=3154616 RepID=UPI0034266A8C
MQKHRKRTHYKKISIAAVTLGIVGIPTAAMACLDTQESGAATAAGRHVRPSHSVPTTGAPTPDASLQNQAGNASTPIATVEPPTPVTTSTPVVERPHKAKPYTGAKKPPTVTKPVRPSQPSPARPTAPVATTQPTSPTAPSSGPAAEVVALVNQERAKAGCSALTVNAKLTTAALNHSKDMAAHSNMSHTGSDGSDPGARITRAGYSWMTYGENVAYGYSTPEQVMNGWMNSPGHRQNILNCAFKEIGVGLAEPNSYWTQDFGAAR